jgi:hypothetical protein
MKIYMGKWRYSSTFDAGKWSASRPCRFIPEKTTSRTHCRGVKVVKISSLDVIKIRKIHSIPIYPTSLRSILLSGARGFNFRQRQYFSLPQSVQTGSGTHPASYPVGTGSDFLGVKRPRRESHRSPTSSAEVKHIYLLA